MKTYFHGECVVSKIEKLPSGLKKLEPKNKRYIVADSETSGNHHCIEEIEGAEMYEKDGVLYLKADVPVRLYCVDEKRHDTQVLEPGIYEIDRANEFDYLTGMKQKVQD